MQPEPAAVMLAVGGGLHVAAGEIRGDLVKTFFWRDQIAIRIGFELACEDLGVGDVADPRKHRAAGNSQLSAAFKVAANAGR